MRKNLLILILTTSAFCSCGQNHKSTTDNVNSDVKTVDTITLNENRIKTQDFSYDSYIHTEANYIDSSGKGIIIQNSYPRGGGSIYSSNEKQYGHAIFWTRVVNKEDRPLELTINFPADSIIIFPTSNVHFKLLVPPDRMTVDKISTFSFGLGGVETFVNKNFHQPSQIRRTIHPNEDCLFYIILLSHFAQPDKGVRRTGLFLKEQNLYYKLSIDSLHSKLIPCGRIAFKN